jgi:hypothetical protein
MKEEHLTTALPFMSPSLHLACSLSALLILPSASSALAQWSTQSLIPTDLDIRGIAVPTAQRVFVGTTDDSFDDSGALFKSADGAATWGAGATPPTGCASGTYLVCLSTPSFTTTRCVLRVR